MTVNVSFFGVDLVVDGDYQEAEAMVMYYKDGSGYPGCDSDLIVNKVTTKNGDDITELFDYDFHIVRKRYDTNVTPRAEIKTVGASLMELLVEECIMKIEDNDDTDY